MAAIAIHVPNSFKYLWLCEDNVGIGSKEYKGIVLQNLIDWVCLSEQIKENNNTICNLTGEYKKIEPDCREGVRAQLEGMKELCKERNNLYEKQNDLKGQKWKIEKLLER